MSTSAATTLDTRARLSRALPGTPPAAPARIVHLGLGTFHRAHQVWYTAHAGDGADWGIAGERASALGMRHGGGRLDPEPAGQGVPVDDPGAEAYLALVEAEDETAVRSVLDSLDPPRGVAEGLGSDDDLVAAASPSCPRWSRSRVDRRAQRGDLT